jgi:hypothetical protein
LFIEDVGNEVPGPLFVAIERLEAGPVVKDLVVDTLFLETSGV